MKKIFKWSEWSLATKILVIFLSLLVISMSVIVSLAIVNIRDLGTFANNTSYTLGESAIRDSTTHLNRLGEEMIKQKAQDVASQVNLYLKAHPVMSVWDMREDEELRSIIVQQVGIEGYTTLIDSINYVIIVHKYRERETNISSKKEYLPSFWSLLVASSSGQPTSGYYDWEEVEGTMRQKFAAIVPIENAGGGLTLWATTYIDEFTKPAEDTTREIKESIAYSSSYIANNVKEMENTFAVIVTALVIVVIALALLWSKLITQPILELKKGAEAIESGKLDYKLKVKSKDELGELAETFNRMASALIRYTDELKSTAQENINQEKRIQDNLRSYATLISQAQETERKRIARDLHDETAQALVVISRHLEDLSAGKSKLTAGEIREEVRKVLEGVRRFSQELRPSILDDLGLIPAVKWLTSDLVKTNGINVETIVTGNSHKLNSQTELMLFRIIQEALTNVRKHAQATQVLIKIEFLENSLKLSVQDNGKGFLSPDKLSDLAGKGKLGLLGMQERVQLMGGVLTIESLPQHGTVLKIEVKLDQNADINT
jgi:two-component system sensor histidine kinase DegS